MRRRNLVRNTLRSLFFTAGVCYLGFHSLHGEQGLYALIVESHKREVLSQELAKAKDDRAKLEHRVALLRPETVDPDLLDEQSRKYLGVVGKDEIVVLNK